MMLAVQNKRADKNKLPLTWASRTEVGHVRTHNEDSFLVKPPLFAVADGMGGHAAGEVASSITVNTLAQAAPAHADAEALGRAVEQANHAVMDASEAGQGKPGMGTTCTAAMIEGSKLAIAHVGDSRAYLLHKGTLIRVTHDHSFVEELVDSGEITADEARVHPNRSIITRALGSDRNMYADHFELTVEEDDRLLLCSDGLSGMLTDSEIEDIMVTSPHPEECVTALVEAALRAGGEDNVTAIVVDISNKEITKHARKHTVRNIVIWVAGLLAALTIVAGAVGLYAANSWFIVDRDGYVTVYKGLPGSFGPISLNQLENQTTIEVSSLAPSTAKRLKEGIQISSAENVDKLLQNYRDQITEEARNKAENASANEPSKDGTPAPTPAAPGSLNPSGSSFPAPLEPAPTHPQDNTEMFKPENTPQAPNQQGAGD